MAEPTVADPRRTYGPERPAVRDGILAGLLGAAIVAAWYLILDVVQGRMFFTPSALWYAVALGAGDPEQVEVGLLPVLGYSVIHFGVWALIGMIASLILNRTRKQPAALLGFVLLAAVSIVLFIGLVSILSVWLVDVLRWWTIAVANLLAAAGMVALLAKRQPAIGRALRTRSLEEPA
jgi:hypothetical protein